MFGSVRVSVRVCAPEAGCVSESMSENTGVSVGGTALAFF